MYEQNILYQTNKHLSYMVIVGILLIILGTVLYIIDEPIKNGYPMSNLKGYMGSIGLIWVGSIFVFKYSTFLAGFTLLLCGLGTLYYTISKKLILTSKQHKPHLLVFCIIVIPIGIVIMLVK